MLLVTLLWYCFVLPTFAQLLIKGYEMLVRKQRPPQVWRQRWAFHRRTGPDALLARHQWLCLLLQEIGSSPGALPWCVHLRPVCILTGRSHSRKILIGEYSPRWTRVIPHGRSSRAGGIRLFLPVLGAAGGWKPLFRGGGPACCRRNCACVHQPPDMRGGAHARRWGARNAVVRSNSLGILRAAGCAYAVLCTGLRLFLCFLQAGAEGRRKCLIPCLTSDDRIVGCFSTGPGGPRSVAA
jgi:hypothetical protein